MQDLVKFNCHFSWQAHYSVKFHSVCTCIFRGKAIFGEVQLSLFVAGAVYFVQFGRIAGARSVAFFHTHARGEREK